MVGAELVPFAQMNSNFFHAYCYFQIADTHGLGESHLYWNLEEALDRWQGGSLQGEKRSRASLEENNRTLELILKDSGVCGLRSLPGTLAQGSVSLDVHGRKQQLH